MSVTHPSTKPVTTSAPPIGRSIPVNSTVRATAEERPVSPTANLSYHLQALATTTEAQEQHIHQPLVLQGDERSTTQYVSPLSSVIGAGQKSTGTRRVSTDRQNTQPAVVQLGNTFLYNYDIVVHLSGVILTI